MPDEVEKDRTVAGMAASSAVDLGEGQVVMTKDELHLARLGYKQGGWLRSVLSGEAEVGGFGR